MQKLIYILLLTLFLQINGSAQNSNDTIRVISYNIWNGFEWGEDKDREQKFIKYIQKQAPEVLALQELCGFTQEKLSKLAKKWGHNYAIIHKEGGYPVGVTSKKPIEMVGKLTENCGHGMLHIRTYGYDMIVTHLNPFDYKKRLIEANNIVDYMANNNLNNNTLLMGDLNAHSPHDANYLEQNSSQLLSDKSAANLSEGSFDYSVLSRFLSYPLIDICQKYVAESRRETYPTLVFTTTQKEIQERVTDRIDFILMTPDLRINVVDAFIPNRGDTDYLSDHYPVFVDLTIK